MINSGASSTSRSRSTSTWHRWSSGRIVPCHGTDPGSIPGRCTRKFLFFRFVFWLFRSVHLKFLNVINPKFYNMVFTLFYLRRLSHCLTCTKKSFVLLLPMVQTTFYSRLDNDTNISLYLYSMLANSINKLHYLLYIFHYLLNIFQILAFDLQV